jgi:hypothetical protein
MTIIYEHILTVQSNLKCTNHKNYLPALIIAAVNYNNTRIYYVRGSLEMRGRKFLHHLYPPPFYYIFFERIYQKGPISERVRWDSDPRHFNPEKQF